MFHALMRFIARLYSVDSCLQNEKNAERKSRPVARLTHCVNYISRFFCNNNTLPNQKYLYVNTIWAYIFHENVKQTNANLGTEQMK